MSELVPTYEVSSWFGIGAPKHTPPEIINQLNRAINAGLSDVKVRAQLADLGATVFEGSPTEFGALIADETEKWGKLYPSSQDQVDLKWCVQNGEVIGASSAARSGVGPSALYSDMALAPSAARSSFLNCASASLRCFSSIMVIP